LINHRLRRFILNGGLIAYPTESCYGLGCSPFLYKATMKINILKNRAKNKNFIVIGNNLTQFDRLINIMNANEKSKIYTKGPGPHTWLIKPNIRSPKWLISSNKIALRIPSFMPCRRIINEISHSFISTSLNKSGKRPIKNYRDACRLFSGKVKIIKGRIGKNRKPSSIHDFSSGIIYRD
jgi:L-threonylcarbamoyladenylate synthase